MSHARFPSFLHPRRTSVDPPRDHRPAGGARFSLIATCGALALAVVAALTATAGAAVVGPHHPAAARPTAHKPVAAKQSGPRFVHDPTLAREHGTYYLFSTGDPAGILGNGNVQIRTSRNAKN